MTCTFLWVNPSIKLYINIKKNYRRVFDLSRLSTYLSNNPRMYMYWNPESALTIHEHPPPSLHICIDFWAKCTKGQIQGRAIIGQWGPFSTGLYSNKLNIWQWSKSIWEEVLIFLAFSFWHILVSCMWLSHFHLLPSKYIYGAKCLIYIHLCTFHVKENSARLQWYSCARYKAPGPIVSSPELKAQVS